MWCFALKLRFCLPQDRWQLQQSRDQSDHPPCYSRQCRRAVAALFHATGIWCPFTGPKGVGLRLVKMCSLLFVHLSRLLDVTSEKLKIVSCEILQSVDLDIPCFLINGVEVSRFYRCNSVISSRRCVTLPSNTQLTRWVSSRRGYRWPPMVAMDATMHEQLPPKGWILVSVWAFLDSDVPQLLHTLPFTGLPLPYKRSLGRCWIWWRDAVWSRFGHPVLTIAYSSTLCLGSPVFADTATTFPARWSRPDNWNDDSDTVEYLLMKDDNQ